MLRKIFFAALAILSLATAADAVVQGQSQSVVDQTARNTSAQTARDHKKLADAVGQRAPAWNQAVTDVADLKVKISNTGLTEAEIEALVMRLLRKHAVELNGPTLKALKADIAAAKSQGETNTKSIAEVRKDIGDLKTSFATNDTRLKRFETELQKLGVKGQTMAADVAKLRSDLSAMATQTSNSISAIEGRVAKLESLSPKVTELTNNLDTLDARVPDGLETTLEDLGEKIDSARSELRGRLDIVEEAARILAAGIQNDPEHGGDKPKPGHGKYKVQQAGRDAAAKLPPPPPEDE